MSNGRVNFMEKDLFSELKNYLQFSKLGFEKESLRVLNSNIARTPHPQSLGSALCNKFITTDFAEAQLELVTPPFQNKEEATKYLDNIHHFVSCNLDGEILWPFSMPPLISSEEEISIAFYGPSNLGVFKRIYRNGLSHRYGRMMQAISGLHFNYSLPNSFWEESSLIKASGSEEKQARSSIYFNMLRNIYRVNWLILYLFGASPIITRNFITKDLQSFKQLDDQSYYLPNATSLRMSDYGYSNLSRNTLRVSINSIDEYVSDLKKARSTFEPKFSKFKLGSELFRQQISQNILQIDDEYYAIARAKSKLEDMRNTSSKLENHGVDFIELRSLDLDPFSRIGISEEAARVTELLLILCLINQSDLLSDSDFDEIDQNNALVAKQGRKANLYLKKNGDKILLKDWAKQIVDSLFPIAEILDQTDSKYSNSLNKTLGMIDDPGLTISGRIMDQILSNNLSFHQFGEEIGKENMAYYLSLNKKNNESWKELENETIRSFEMQDNLEEDKHKSFEAYLDDFLG